MSNVSWDDQRVFLAVIEEGSLSGAARRLKVAQPTVRARIEALERALGTSLFTRSVNGLTPTEQARALHGRARAMANASEAFVRAAASSPDRVEGVVRISVSEFVGVEVLPAMLAGLREAHPGLIVEAVLSNAAAALLEQEADIAVRMHPPTQAALVAKRIGDIPLGLFAHPDYLRRRGMPATRDDLLSHDFIGPDRAASDLALAPGVHPRIGRERFVLRTDSHPAQYAAARAGLGIAIVQRPTGAACPDLVAVLPELVVAALPTWIVTHEDLRHLPRVRAAFDHLVAGFEAYCAGA